MSTRLTKELRRWIVDRVIESIFASETAALVIAENQLAMLLLDTFVPQADRERVFASCPPAWFPTAQTLSVGIDGTRIRECLALPKLTTVPFYLYDETLHLKQRHPLAVRIKTFCKKRDALNDARRKRKFEVQSFLQQFSSTKRLAKAWPGIAPLIQQIDEKFTHKTSSANAEPTRAVKIPDGLENLKLG